MIEERLFRREEKWTQVLWELMIENIRRDVIIRYQKPSYVMFRESLGK